MFKKLAPSLLSIGGLLLTAFTPSIQHAVGSFVVAHPSVAAAITAAFGIINHFWPSPLK
jgi:hypothetical protein